MLVVLLGNVSRGELPEERAEFEGLMRCTIALNRKSNLKPRQSVLLQAAEALSQSPGTCKQVNYGDRIIQTTLHV